jgi:hypothetical protein
LGSREKQDRGQRPCAAGPAAVRVMHGGSANGRCGTEQQRARPHRQANSSPASLRWLLAAPIRALLTFQNTGMAPCSKPPRLLRQAEGGTYWPSGIAVVSTVCRYRIPGMALSRGPNDRQFPTSKIEAPVNEVSIAALVKIPRPGDQAASDVREES